MLAKCFRSRSDLGPKCFFSNKANLTNGIYKISKLIINWIEMN